MHVRTAVAALFSFGTLAGCTAILSTVKVVQADHDVREVGARGAGQLAPYEYTLAQRYAAKAIQESGDGENHTAIDLAKIAVVYADAANRRMAGGGRGLEEMQRAESADPLMEDEAPSGATPQRATPQRDTPTPDSSRGEDHDTDDDFLKEDDEENVP